MVFRRPRRRRQRSRPSPRRTALAPGRTSATASLPGVQRRCQRISRHRAQRRRSQRRLSGRRVASCSARSAPAAASASRMRSASRATTTRSLVVKAPRRDVRPVRDTSTLSADTIATCAASTPRGPYGPAHLEQRHGVGVAGAGRARRGVRVVASPDQEGAEVGGGRAGRRDGASRRPEAWPNGREPSARPVRTVPGVTRGRPARRRARGRPTRRYVARSAAWPEAAWCSPGGARRTSGVERRWSGTPATPGGRLDRPLQHRRRRHGVTVARRHDHRAASPEARRGPSGRRQARDRWTSTTLPLRRGAGSIEVRDAAASGSADAGSGPPAWWSPQDGRRQRRRRFAGGHRDLTPGRRRYASGAMHRDAARQAAPAGGARGRAAESPDLLAGTPYGDCGLPMSVVLAEGGGAAYRWWRGPRGTAERRRSANRGSPLQRWPQIVLEGIIDQILDRGRAGLQRWAWSKSPPATASTWPACECRTNVDSSNCRSKQVAKDRTISRRPEAGVSGRPCNSSAGPAMLRPATSAWSRRKATVAALIRPEEQSRRRTNQNDSRWTAAAPPHGPGGVIDTCTTFAGTWTSRSASSVSKVGRT